MSRILLASASPRRRELLARMNVPHACAAADVDETCFGPADARVQTLALRKARAVSQVETDAFVIGADTLVEIGGEILGKPTDERDAARMLTALAGNWHDVYTGVALVSGEYEDVAFEHSRVRFTPMTSSEILDYIATGEPMDKAGAYGIQGYAGQYIDRIEGCYFNIMGLPMALLRRMFKKAELVSD